jgi:1-acyl-sn-glycerol-3-phosphate acyltransferase
MEGQLVATILFLIFNLIYLPLLSLSFPPEWIPLWVIVSYFISFVSVVMVYLLQFPLVLSLSATHPYKAYLMRSIAALINHFFLRLQVIVSGLEHVPKDGKLVIYANHKSYSDGFALLEVLNRPFAFTPKSSVMKVPILSHWLKAYEVFPINRKSVKETAVHLEKAIDSVSRGIAISLFPEGTIKYRDQSTVTEMKPGAFKLALRAQADILIVRFDGNHLTKHRTPFRSTKRYITILPVLKFEEYQELSTSEIAQLVMERINQTPSKDLGNKK